MALKKFDPWQYLGKTAKHAYPAYSAYPTRFLGRIGGLCIDDHFKTGLALRKLEFRVSQQSLTRVTAPEKTILHSDRYHELLHSVKPQTAHHTSLIASALNLVETPWITQLVALGWDDISLFGCDLLGNRLIGLVTVLGTGTIAAATADTVRYIDQAGAAKHHFRSRAPTAGSCLLWEVAR